MYALYTHPRFQFVLQSGVQSDAVFDEDKQIGTAMMLDAANAMDYVRTALSQFSVILQAELWDAVDAELAADTAAATAAAATAAATNSTSTAAATVGDADDIAGAQDDDDDDDELFEDAS